MRSRLRRNHLRKSLPGEWNASTIGLSSLELDHRKLRRHTNAPRISDASITAVDIQILIAFAVKAGPLLINVLGRTPPEISELYSHLGAVGMSREHDVYFGKVGPHLRVPVTRIVR